ncbi:hypothetical protein MHU86_23928 [Fragilaria crotonensis]|nr:hypothetical protein MHU86_23928 [Fragilaria crotonensis]
MALLPRLYQSPSEPSYFVRYDKHNQWLRLLFFVDDMLYAGSNDSIEKQFEDSVRNRFDVKFLGPAQWFLQMRIHKHSDSSYTLDQHRYVLNTLQRYDPNSNSRTRYPFPPDYTFSKDNRPVTALTSPSSNTSNNAFPSALPSALSSTLHTIQELTSYLLSANLLKHASLLAYLIFEPYLGSSAIFAAAPTMLSNSTPMALQIPSMTSAFTIVSHTPISPFSPTPAGKTALTLAVPLLDT